MKDLNQSLVESAIQIFGAPIVHQVIQLVQVSDPDGIWSLYNDMGYDEHMYCVEYLYFDHN